MGDGGIAAVFKGLAADAAGTARKIAHSVGGIAEKTADMIRGQQFTTLFADVRDKAPKQKAVVTATVALTGVRSITDDTAVVVIFMNQIATRTAESGPAQQLASAGRLTVTAKNIGGSWKIADVQAV